MKRKKSARSIFKKKLHPFVGYAFLIGAGAIGITSASPLMTPKDRATIAPLVAPANETTPPTIPTAVKNDLPNDFESLKEAAAQFASQLKIIKAQVAQLNALGRTPPSALTDAIGQGEQLTGVIAAAQKMSDIGETDPALKLQTIGSNIAANSRF